MDQLKMYFLFKGVVFHCYVSLPEGTCSIPASKNTVNGSEIPNNHRLDGFLTLLKNGIIIILGGAGFCPSTVWRFLVSIVKFLVCMSGLITMALGTVPFSVGLWDPFQMAELHGLHMGSTNITWTLCFLWRSVVCWFGHSWKMRSTVSAWNIITNQQKDRWLAHIGPMESRNWQIIVTFISVTLSSSSFSSSSSWLVNLPPPTTHHPQKLWFHFRP